MFMLLCSLHSNLSTTNPTQVAKNKGLSKDCSLCHEYSTCMTKKIKVSMGESNLLRRKKGYFAT